MPKTTNVQRKSDEIIQAEIICNFMGAAIYEIFKNNFSALAITELAVLHAAVFFQNGGGVVKIVGGGGVIGVRSRDFAD